jgi:hypothetical protein
MLLERFPQRILEQVAFTAFPLVHFLGQCGSTTSLGMHIWSIALGTGGQAQASLSGIKAMGSTEGSHGARHPWFVMYIALPTPASAHLPLLQLSQ